MSAKPDLHADCRRLHALACKLTGREERYVLHAQAWHALLATYEINALQLANDLRLLVTYLQRMIRAGSRNVGALKLRNLLALDRFDEDLQEARAVLRKRPAPAATREAVQQVGDVQRTVEAPNVQEPQPMHEEMAKNLGEWMEKMKRGEAP